MVSLPVLQVVLVLIGIALGLGLGFFVLPARRQAKQLRAELEALRNEHDSYKTGVSAHFVKTAELVGEMTKTYAAVYDHLAGGAQQFCGDLSDTALPFSSRPALIEDAIPTTAVMESETRMREAEPVVVAVRTSVPTGAVIEEAGAVDVARAPGGIAAAAAVLGANGARSDSMSARPRAGTEDDPLHATEGMMPEPGVVASPGELEDGAPAGPKF